MTMRQLLLLSFVVLNSLNTVACIDSVWVNTRPVQCFGLRNGKMTIEKVFGGEGPFYYSIDGQSFSTNPDFDHLWAGEYTLFIRDKSGCISTRDFVIDEPGEFKVRINASDTLVIAGKEIVLQAWYSPEIAVLESIEWRPPHLFPKQDTLRQMVSISHATDIAIELKDKNGCIARNQLTLEVEKTNIYAPNVIQPGSAQDAYFTLYSGEGVTKIASLKIFSRTGSLLFEQRDILANDPQKGWNGRWNGRIVQSGVYLWLAEIEMLDGSLQKMEGTVTVIQ